MDLLYKEEIYKIVGAAMEVHRELGCGFLEAVYEEALTRELNYKSIPFEQQKQLIISYKGEELKKYYVADLVCYNSIIIELKALNAIVPEHEAQLLNYLKATNYRIGLIVNFGTKSLQYKRYIL